MLAHLSQPFARMARRLVLPLWLVVAGTAVAVVPNAQETAVAALLTTDAGQQRPALVWSDTLATVARNRALDMAARNYFAHTNPDGYAANWLVQQAGYALPSWWGTAPAANYIESISAGYTTASAAWSGWMASSGHKTHLLGQTEFYRGQTCYGVGYAYNPQSTYKHYWVVITAPPTPYMEWKMQLLTAAASDAGDPDADGLCNLLEYALGSDPSVPSPAAVPAPSVSGGRLRLTYARPRSDVTYVVETSVDCRTWTTSGVDQGGTGTSVTASIPEPVTGMRFLRLRVSGSPPQ